MIGVIVPSVAVTDVEVPTGRIDCEALQPVEPRQQRIGGVAVSGRAVPCHRRHRSRGAHAANDVAPDLRHIDHVSCIHRQCLRLVELGVGLRTISRGVLAIASEGGDDTGERDATLHPQGQEVCNGVDDNCRDGADEGLLLTTYYRDADGDGFGAVVGQTRVACGQPSGYSTTNDDCADDNADIFPGAPEYCNDRDDDCDGWEDENLNKPYFYFDQDGDGYGGTTVVQACMPPPGYVDNSGDCTDYNAHVHPGAPEQCNEIDDNCNYAVDESVPTLTVYRDADGDRATYLAAMPLVVSLSSTTPRLRRAHRQPNEHQYNTFGHSRNRRGGRHSTRA